jgi:Protein of unknown function (DUF3015)
MYRLYNSWIAALVVITSLVAGTARAQSYNCVDADCLPLTLTTSGTTTTTVGVVVLISLLSNKDNTKASQDAAKAAEYYLRQSSLQLAQDLASGQGAVLDELASALQVSPENEPAFRELMRKDRSELLALVDVTRLNPDRATLFVRRLMALMESHPGLRRDLHERVARAGAA